MKNVTTEEIKELASFLNIGIPIIVAIIVLAFCITNIDKLLILLSKIQSLFIWCSQKAKKGSISNSIRGKIMRSAKSFKNLDDDILINDLKIEWVKEENPESFINNQQVIVRLQQNVNPHKNFVSAVTTFVGQGLLPKSRRYIDKDIFSVSHLAVSRFLIQNGDSEALNYFDEHYLDPLLKNEAIKEDFERIKTIDGNGMFINILLKEYAKATRKIYPDIPDPQLIAESKELLTYLYRIALGVITDFSEFSFNREYFKIHIFLTARSATYAHSGIKPYLKHIDESINSGTETIYIFGLGRKGEVAEEIAKSAKENDFRVEAIIPHRYRHKSQRNGKIIKGVCYEIPIYKLDEDESL